MSDPGSVGPEKTTSPKKPISPVRNIIGLIVLIAVIAVGWFQYSALLAFNAMESKLAARSEDEKADLMTVQEAEGLIGKTPDGPGTDFNDGSFNYTKKTYTWPGLLKSYTLTAYYTKEKESHLHHYETEGAKLAKPPAVAPPPPSKQGPPPKAAPRGAPQPAPKPADGAPKPTEGSKSAEGSKPADGPKAAPTPAPTPAKDGK